ncbi:MAG: NrfD/PsrC family molybdoenzyme membrane anchor subunit [Actinomycetota bacterium]
MSAVVETRDIRRGSGKVWHGILAVGLVIGLGSFLYQWNVGLGVTGLSNTVSWGMYIITFMFLVGVSAGGLIVVAGAELVGTKRFEHLSRLAVLVSATAIAAAAISIVPDLGRPQYAWKIFTQPNPTSPLVWDVIVITMYLSIAGIDLWLLTRARPMHDAMKKMAVITLPVAVLVHSVTAWIFGLLVARPFWNTALMAPLFISSALVSGTALLIIVAHIAERKTDFAPPERSFADLAKLMLWFIAVDAFLLFAEVLTSYASGVPDHVDQLNVILFGRLAPVFWSEVAFGVIVPFLIFSRNSLRVRRGWVVAASALAVGGVFLKRINILMSSMFEPLVGLAPGIPGGRPGQSFRADQIYIPSVIEFGILIGLFAFIGTVITIGVRKLVIPHQER